MNKNEECEIIEDLLYGYNEKMLNQKSKEFVDNHLKNCKSCNNKLEKIRSNIFKEKKKEEQEDKIELSHLLKINKVIRILKISLVILFLIILLFLGFTFSRGYRTNYIVNNAYTKLEELKQLNNYKITKRVKYISHGLGKTDDTITEIYYKDGKYKQVIPGTIFFYEEDSNEITYIYKELKRIEKGVKPINTAKGYNFEEETGIKGIYSNEENAFQKAVYKIRNDSFDGIDCYVIRIERDNKQYEEIWINKENFITVRSIENFTAYYREIIYNIIINETLDAEVTLDEDDYSEYTFNDLTKKSERRNAMIYND